MFEVEGGIIRVAEGWARGAEADKGARWDPAEIGDAVAKLIAEAIERLRAHGPLLVCCALGYSRSAASVAAWLLRSGRATDTDAAVAIVRTARPGVVLGAAHLHAITAAAGART